MSGPATGSADTSTASPSAELPIPSGAEGAEEVEKKSVYILAEIQ